ncbi:hypothetical protein L204_100006 [Cryptococcus depauperatus]
MLYINGTKSLTLNRILSHTPLSLQLKIHGALFRDLSSANHLFVLKIRAALLLLASSAMAQFFSAAGRITSTSYSTFCLKHSRTFSFRLDGLIVAHVHGAFS